MRTSCVQHPSKEPLIIIHAWQLALCDGNQCAAALLSFFEYWHNIKLENQEKARQANDIAEKHNEPRVHDETLWQWHTTTQLERGTMIFRRTSIAQALTLLVSKHFVTLSSNPNPRYRFDRTRFILFHPEEVNSRLRIYTLQDAEQYLSGHDEPKAVCLSAENGSPSTENGHSSRARPISGSPKTETTTETTTEKKPSPPLSPAGGKRPRAKKSRVLALDYSDSFLDFWQTYPSVRAVAKPECWQLWRDRQLELRAGEIIGKIERLKETSWQGKEPRFIPLAHTWLNQGRYEDGLLSLETASTQRVSDKGLRTAMASKRILEERADESTGNRLLS